jgi:hypothetical protein
MTTPTNSDIAAIEAALAAIKNPPKAADALMAARDRRDAVRELFDVCDPARLRRVLDTMQAMGEALEDAAHHLEQLDRSAYVEGGTVDREVIATARAALALYEGTK